MMEKIFRSKWAKLTISRYMHWTIKYEVPSDDCDSWEWDNERPHGQRAIHRAWIIIGIGRLFFQLYLWKVTPFEGSWDGDNTKQYGITYFERSLHVHWGRTKVYWLPWDWKIVRHDLLHMDGSLYYRNSYPIKKRSYSWYEVLEMKESPFPKSDVQTQVADYVELTHYTKDGRKQVAKIRLVGEEREWRWRWFSWLPWPRQISRVVDCSSDVELGERAGSWKGGMMGWSAPLEKGQSLREAFYAWYRKWDGR